MSCFLNLAQVLISISFAKIFLLFFLIRIISRFKCFQIMIIYRIVIVNFDLDRTRYGRKKLIGSLMSNGFSFGKRQVAQALQSISRVAISHRKIKAGWLLSPRVYSANILVIKLGMNTKKNWECTKLFMFVQAMVLWYERWLHSNANKKH